MAITNSEKFVFDLCNNTFLKLWCHDNPIGKKTKELCDVLIICGNDILIFSVKEININPSGNSQVDDSRWLKRAIESSVKQVYGAERILALKEKILLKDFKTEIQLPPKDKRVIHRVCVSIGRGTERSLKFGDFGQGFVHVFDEDSVHTILTELDTITDFIEYLSAKEQLIESGKEIVFSNEKDLLAHFLLAGRTFQVEDSLSQFNILAYENGIWEEFVIDADYREFKNNIQVSYFWDELIDNFIKHHFDNSLIVPISRSNLDASIFMMARETRRSRLVLSTLLIEHIKNQEKPRINSRTVHSPINENVLYYWLLKKTDPVNRKERLNELSLRCIAARQRAGKGDFVIGIATDPFDSNIEAFDFCSIDASNWTKEDEDLASEIIASLNIKTNKEITRRF